MTDEEGNPGQPLELRSEGSDGLRYYLCGEGVHAGDLLEMLSDDGTWERVRYEYHWNLKERRLTAYLHCRADRCIVLPPTARFRWPAR